MAYQNNHTAATDHTRALHTARMPWITRLVIALGKWRVCFNEATAFCRGSQPSHEPLFCKAFSGQLRVLFFIKPKHSMSIIALSINICKYLIVKELSAASADRGLARHLSARVAQAQSHNDGIALNRLKIFSQAHHLGIDLIGDSQIHN